jgi:hypothetical protein
MGLVSWSPVRWFEPTKALLPVDLSGRVVVDTGAKFALVPRTQSRGFGCSLVKHFACWGAKVYLAVRDELKAAIVVVQLQPEGFGTSFG